MPSLVRSVDAGAATAAFAADAIAFLPRPLALARSARRCARCCRMTREYRWLAREDPLATHATCYSAASPRCSGHATANDHGPAFCRGRADVSLRGSVWLRRYVRCRTGSRSGSACRVCAPGRNGG